MLDYVREVVLRDGIAPSYGMICEAIGIATRQEVSRMVQAAERAGELRRVGIGKVRRIRLVESVSAV
jgi:hypothetical protein